MLHGKQMTRTDSWTFCLIVPYPLTTSASDTHIKQKVIAFKIGMEIRPTATAVTKDIDEVLFMDSLHLQAEQFKVPNSRWDAVVGGTHSRRLFCPY